MATEKELVVEGSVVLLSTYSGSVAFAVLVLRTGPE